MRRKIRTVCLWVMPLLFAAAIGCAASDTPKSGAAKAQTAVPAPPRATGADWLLMSGKEKEKCAADVLAFLRAKGVPVSRPASFYGAALNSVTDQRGAEKAGVTNLITSLVYNAEPQTRQIIDELRVKPPVKSAPASKSYSSKNTDAKNKAHLY